MISIINFQNAIDLISNDPLKTWGIGFSNRACSFVGQTIQAHKKINVDNIIGLPLISVQTLYHSSVVNGDRFIVEGVGKRYDVEEWLPKSHESIKLTLQELVLRNIYRDQEYKILSCLDILNSDQVSLNTKERQALIIFRNKLIGSAVRKKDILYDPICRPGIFKQSYCTTAYRCQGGEIDNVVLMIKSISQIQRFSNGNKFLYSAITRAKKKLFICEDPRL